MTDAYSYPQEFQDLHLDDSGYVPSCSRRRLCAPAHPISPAAQN